MSINIITQFRTMQGRDQKLISLIRKVLLEGREHDGCIGKDKHPASWCIEAFEN